MKAVKWILLAALIVIVAAAASGVLAYNKGKQEGMRAGLAARTQFLQERGIGAGNPVPGGATTPGQNTTGRGGQGGMAGNFTAGQVKSISGNELEISTTNGVTKVKLNDKTQVEKTVAGAASDIKVGDRVVVQGTRAADGSLEASTIQLGGGRFFGPGAPGAPAQGGQ
ncbi:MAG: DUF5666 domain-containing protein [Anaerolineae bacterium]